jgi:hypothetical protein
MKGLDIWVVRFLPFILYSIIGINILLAFKGVDLTAFYLLHSNSAIYALGLYLISYSNKKYHCEYNRYMLLCLIITPLINFLDEIFYIFPSEESYIYVVVGIYLFTLGATACSAVNHFVLASKRRLDNGN